MSKYMYIPYFLHNILQAASFSFSIIQFHLLRDKKFEHVITIVFEQQLVFNSLLLMIALLFSVYPSFSILDCSKSPHSCISIVDDEDVLRDKNLNMS